MDDFDWSQFYQPSSWGFSPPADGGSGNVPAQPSSSNVPVITVRPRSPQQTYRLSQAGYQTAPEDMYVPTGPSLPEIIGNSMADTARIMTSPPMPAPKGSYMDDSGLTYPGKADPKEWEAFVDDQQKRQNLGPSMALSMIGGGTPFAEGAAAGLTGGKLVQPEADAAFLHAPKPDAPFPQYAEQYPPVGPPTLTSKATEEPIEGVKGSYLQPNSKAQKMVDAGEAFWQKTPTPEAEDFAKQRLATMKDMKQNGYTPYFDPELRQHVDPADYPTNIDTTRDAMPAKPATIAKYQTMMDTPEGRARLQAGYDTGLATPGSKDWYAMKQLQDEFIKELGPEEGRAAFQRKFANSMAATTGGADPRSNYLMSLYHNYLIENGMPTPPSHQFPYPIGGRYASNNMKQADKAMRDPNFTGFDENNPKRHDFSFAFMGHPNKFTMDEQMSSGLVPKMQIPPGDSYGIAAGVGHDLAAANNVAPRDFQDVAWAGLKRQKVEGEGKKFNYEGPMINQVNDAIERTHRLTGMPRAEIVKRGIIRNQIPIYGLGGAAIGLPMLSGFEDQSGS